MIYTFPFFLRWRGNDNFWLFFSLTHFYKKKGDIISVSNDWIDEKSSYTFPYHIRGNDNYPALVLYTLAKYYKVKHFISIPVFQSFFVVYVQACTQCACQNVRSPLFLCSLPTEAGIGLVQDSSMEVGLAVTAVIIPPCCALPEGVLFVSSHLDPDDEKAEDSGARARKSPYLGKPTHILRICFALLWISNDGRRLVGPSNLLDCVTGGFSSSPNFFAKRKTLCATDFSALATVVGLLRGRCSVDGIVRTAWCLVSPIWSKKDPLIKLDILVYYKLFIGTPAGSGWRYRFLSPVFKLNNLRACNPKFGAT